MRYWKRYRLKDLQIEKSINLVSYDTKAANNFLSKVDLRKIIRRNEYDPIHIDKSIAFFNRDGEIFLTDTNLQKIEQIELSYFNDVSDKYQLMLDDDLVYLYDLAGNRLAEFKHSGEAFLNGELLFLVDGKVFTVVDLSKLDF
jgi:hypothetical protein